MIKTSRRTFLAAGASLGAAPAFAQSSRDDALARGFAAPPDAAKPRVWWHWMNGNITREGIAQDLAWMNRIGIGGVQNFDAALNTPQVVDHRLVYMSPEWKQAFRFAVERADQLNLEFAIAASPGWSQTGGPWVQPADAMKKLVWSEAIVTGGAPVSTALPSPPRRSGPFQDMIGLAFPGVDEHGETAEYYAGIAVLAWPLTAGDRLTPRRVTVNGAQIDPALLDGEGIAFPREQAVQFDFGRLQTVRSIVIEAAHAGATIAGATMARVECSSNGASWRAIAEADIGALPSTLSFAPARGRYFRVTFMAPPPAPSGEGWISPAPGVDVTSLIAHIFGNLVTRRPAARLVRLEFSSAPRVNAFEKKAAFELVNDYFALDGYVGADAVGVPLQAVIDITQHMDSDGHLNWTPPAGRWKVLRLGCSLTGKKNHPAPPEATGLEVDKYDAAAVEAYINTYLDMYKDAVGPELMGRRGVRALLNDSTEVGASNWTPRLLEQFRQLRGYDATPWLPALTGEVIGSRAESDAFLFDFRTTLSQLHASEHYGAIARVAHQRGMITYSESLEGGRPTLGDDLDMRAYADIPMAALWTYRHAPQPHHLADPRGAASVAHFMGRTFAAAESLTSVGHPWAHAPRHLQPIIDTLFLAGVNRPVIHTSAHQPTERTPGLSLGVFGQFFTRHETWAEMAKPWIDYLSRNAFLLQQGRNVADVAYFYGEDSPIGPQSAGGLPDDAPTHYAYDYISPQFLMRIAVQNGDLVSEGGARYKLLYLNGRSAHMTLPVLRKIADLVEAGATVVGDRPRNSPALADDEAEFGGIAARLWAGGAVTQVGRGRVFAGRDIEAGLRQIGVPADMSYADGPQTELQFVHRALGDGHLYFVSNRTSESQSRDVRFRVAGKSAEIWRADTGAVAPASYRFDGAHTLVPLDLLPHESVFVLFRTDTAEAERTVARPVLRQVGQIDGGWRVSFQSGRGAPAEASFERLASLSEHADPGVKYFSGVATYAKSFEFPARPAHGEPLWLDLGAVGEIAEVRINGRSAGVAWKAPYRLDIAPLVRRGGNRIEVKVANLWVNRLIGDEQPGAERVAFTTAPTYTAAAPLMPSGLIGPVTLWSE